MKFDTSLFLRKAIESEKVGLGYSSCIFIWKNFQGPRCLYISHHTDEECYKTGTFYPAVNVQIHGRNCEVM